MDEMLFQRRRPVPSDDLPLFATPELPEAPLVAMADHATSRDAADAVAPIAGALRRRVLEAVVATGVTGLTAAELEALPEFTGYGFSTLRKRLSEVSRYQPAVLRAHGKRGGCTVWVDIAIPVEKLPSLNACGFGT